MTRSPTFSPAVPPKTPPLNFIPPAARHSSPGPRSPASPWRRDHAGRRPSSDPLRPSRSHSRQLDGAVGGGPGGLGGGLHGLSLVVAAVEVRGRKPKANGQVLRRHGRYAGR